MVNKSILMRKINKINGIPLRDASGCIDTVVNIIAESVAKGERIELRGLGTFFIRKTAARRTALPNVPSVAEHGRVIFRPSQKLREAVWNTEPKSY
jgi:nucleoid DNA-binding protein